MAGMSKRPLPILFRPCAFREIVSCLCNVPSAVRCYLLPQFSLGFDESAYIGTSFGPSGWWLKFPKLHYCLFNPPDRNEAAKYSSLDTRRPTVLLVTSSPADSEAGTLIRDLVIRHSPGGNVVVISLGNDIPSGVPQCFSTVLPAEISQKDLRFLIRREIGILAARVQPVVGIVNSIVCTPALEAMWREDIPAIHIVEDSTTDPLLQDELAEAACFSGARFFDRHAYLARPDAFEENVIASKSKELADRAIIREDGCFDVGFAYPRLTSRKELALKYYTSSWQTGMFRRKPFPGFHPGIYADHHPDIARDPLADFIHSGKPAGPWLSEVIEPKSAKGLPKLPISLKAALHLHLHYTEPADEIFRLLVESPFRPDLFVSVTSEEGKQTILEKLAEFGLACSDLRLVPNRGRDIGPLFTGFPEIFSSGYDVIGHLHGKKSDYMKRNEADQWTRFLYENLLGSSGLMVSTIMKVMQKTPEIGLIFPDDPSVFGWDDNRDYACSLGEKMGLGQLFDRGHFNFPAGTMFWARPQALKPLVDLEFKWQDYPEEPLGSAGTMLHAIERLLPFVVEKMGFRWAVTHVPGVPR